MSLFLAMMVVVVFGVLLAWLNIESVVLRAAARAHATLRTVRDTSLEDVEKERLLRRQASDLLRLSSAVLGIGLVAMLLPLAGIWVLDRVGIGSLAAVTTILRHPVFLLAATAVGSVAYLLSRATASR